MIDPNSIERLKSTVDIVDVIGSYIELKKAGANYKANCPFHGEKTPSFVVSPAKQIYHCFGCGVGGDAIKFVMEYEKLNYPEAIEKLAASYNIPLRYTQGGKHREGIDEARRVLETMQQWYRANLERHEASQRYLQTRGVTLASIERFGIGYVPKGSEVLRYIDRSALPRPQALEAGVLGQADDGRVYARLSERITFPIDAPSGGLVGFGGRTMTDHPAKYINSPQTKLFNKSRLLYGYHLAKQTIYKRKRLIVCEGYLDVIMLHQAGFSEAVATLGTALTPEHLPLLRKGDPKIVVAYDGDKAGIAAALKAARLLAASDVDGGVTLFPEGNDPADMIKAGRTQEVDRLLREAVPFVAFVIEQTVAQYDLHDAYQKKEAFAQIKDFLDRLDPIIKEANLPFAASQLGIAPALLQAGIKETTQALRTAASSREDIAQLSVLKTMAESPETIAWVLDIADKELFAPYEAMFDAIVHGKEMSHVRALQLDETVRTLSDDEVKTTLRTLLLRHYERRLREIANDRTLPYETKSYKVRKIKADIVPRLQRGELVPLLKEI